MLGFRIQSLRFFRVHLLGANLESSFWLCHRDAVCREELIRL